MAIRFSFGRCIAAAALALTFISAFYYLQISRLSHPLEHAVPWNISVGSWQHPSPPPSVEQKVVWRVRAELVKDAYLHAYRGYLKHAAGFDELQPLSNTGIDKFNGWNVTMYDSLDTMLLMDLHEEFAAALPIVRAGSFQETAYPSAGSIYAPFFETVIRYLGGLLSAFALSGEPTLLTKADQLATILEPAFSNVRGFPVYGINPANSITNDKPGGVLAEIASCQMEWMYLAHATGSKTHFDKVNRVVESLVETMANLQGGMFPTYWNLVTGTPGSDGRSVGAASDSAHEYLLKQFLLTGQQDTANLEMYLLTTNEILTRLLYVTPGRHMLYVTDTSGSAFRPSHHFEHLSCFFPGLLALGAHLLPLTLSSIDAARLNSEAQRAYRLLAQYDLRALHMAAAEGLATSCWLLYKEMSTGLGPEIVDMDSRSGLWMDALEEWRVAGMRGPPPGLDEKQPVPYTRTTMRSKVKGPWDYVVREPEHFLRPETIESMYVMWRVTGNPVWRERGWEIFQALERETKTTSGYASLRTVVDSPAPKLDDQPSYFLAETLKYLYLLFVDDDPVPLDKWVFNTEAHPLPVFSWNDWERHKFDIPSSRRPT